MSDHAIEEEIVQTAYQIGCSTIHEDLFDSQLSFWLSVQSLMRNGGYDAVRKRMSFITEDLAETIAKASLKDIRALCLAEISTVRPSLPDSTIKALLSGQTGEGDQAKMVLQLLGPVNTNFVKIIG
ncbi:MAG: hypothetical protein G8D89_18290 [gamma proteobacterium symbiont of Clathrolucina costata]